MFNEATILTNKKRQKMTEHNKEVEQQNTDAELLLELTSGIISAYVANNPVSSNELPAIIDDVYATIAKIADAGTGSASQAGNQKPAVPVKKSLHQDYIICLEDGKRFKSLKRHLNSHYGLSPEEYRQKWGLPSDYPMVAPSYAKARSRLAKEIGLGKRAGDTTKKVA